MRGDKESNVAEAIVNTNPGEARWKIQPSKIWIRLQIRANAPGGKCFTGRALAHPYLQGWGSGPPVRPV